MKPNLLKNRGAAVVEFAVLLILLMALAFGIIEFGFLWAQSHYIANAAREGARVASKYDQGINPTTAVENAVKDYLKGFYTTAMIDSGCCGSSDFVHVSVNRSATVTGGGVTMQAAEVSVTVQTSQIWKPVLWDLLKLIPGTHADNIDSITQKATFVFQRQT